MTVAPLLFFHDTSDLVNFHRPGLIPVLGPLLRGNVCSVRLWQAFVDASGTPPREIATRSMFETSLD